MNSANKKNSYSRTLKNYKTTEVLTASKESILLLLYEGCIRFLKQATQAIEQNNIPEKSRLIGRAQNIVNELRATLDHQQGGELALSLDALYDFISQRLITANTDNNVQKIQEAIQILTTLHEAWQQAIHSLKKETKDLEKP